MSLPPAFDAKTMTSTCTVWTGAVNNKGYAVIAVDGRLQLAHRVAYEAAHGRIPDGMQLDHICRVRNCVTPEHLEIVTARENGRRGRLASSIQVGDTCINGHEIRVEGDVYERPSGLRECRECIRAGKRGQRATVRRDAAKVTAAVRAADRSAA